MTSSYKFLKACLFVGYLKILIERYLKFQNAISSGVYKCLIALQNFENRNLEDFVGQKGQSMRWDF